MLNIVPLDGYILIEPFEEIDDSGFELPPSLQKNRNIGTVVAVCESLTGYGANSTTPKIIKVKIGDKIYVKDYIDKPIEVEDKKYFFVEYEDILGVQK